MVSGRVIVVILLLSGCAGDPLRSVDPAERSNGAGSLAAMLANPGQSSTQNSLDEIRRTAIEKPHNSAVLQSREIILSCEPDCGGESGAIRATLPLSIWPG